ncbi:hypothetical protein [Scytonema sp. HK-05]
MNFERANFEFKKGQKVVNVISRETHCSEESQEMFRYASGTLRERST